MGAKVQRKFYFLSVSGRSLICIDESTTSPVDNPSGFSGRSSIPASANCIELKPNVPASSDSFCPNSGVILPEKSYVDYDSTSNALLIKKASADGNCGYSLSTTSVPLKSKEYTLYVRAIGVYSIIGSNYQLAGGDYAPIIYPINADFYYYVFSDLDGAINWSLDKLVHTTNELISPFAISSLGATRLLPYLRAKSTGIISKYSLGSIPPSATVSYWNNNSPGELGFGRPDSSIPPSYSNSQDYVEGVYDVKHGTAYYMLFNWEYGGVYPSYPTFILWPLAYDELMSYDLYNRYIDPFTSDSTLVQRAAQYLNQVVGLNDFPGIYGSNMYVNVEINAVQYYPLEPTPKTSDNKYRKLYPDERFDYPIQSGTSWSRTYHLIPALYRSYASVNGPYGWVQAGIWNTIVRYGNPTSNSFNTIYGNYNFIQGKLWSVDQNCNLVYIENDLQTVAGIERRIITSDLPNNFRSFSSTGEITTDNAISIRIFPGVTADIGGNAVRWTSLKYAIDIIYTVRISPDPIFAGTPLTVNPPAVCPPLAFPVMLNNQPYIP
jgi:hypothetical protein